MDVDTRVSQIYTAGWAPLVGLLISVGGSRADAEEVAQGAYEKLLRAWPAVSSYDDPQAWVRRVAIRDLVSRHRRSVVARVKRPLLVEPDWTPDPGAGAIDRVDLRRALAELSVEHRAVLLLHHVEDLSVAEVASELGISPGTVKSRLSRARARLAGVLDLDASEQVGSRHPVAGQETS